MGSFRPPFAIHHGTRQGFPLTPLLFALVIEPLAVWIRCHAQIWGVDWGLALEDRLALYADDVLLFWLALP